jgi:hypothetical protein
MIVGIPISFLDPNTGEERDHPWFGLFWASIGGIVIIVLYSSYKERKERQKANVKRRSKK